MLFYIISLPIDLFLTLINYLLAPFIALFVDKETHTLKGMLKLFSTTDALMNGKGIVVQEDGTLAGGDHSFYERRKGKSLYITYILWLWRNPLNHFEENAIGRYVDMSKLKREGSWDMSEKRHSSKYTFIHQGVGSLLFSPFEFYFHLRYFNSSHFFRGRVGWKLTQYTEHPNKPFTKNKAQFVFVPSPFRTFK